MKILKIRLIIPVLVLVLGVAFGCKEKGPMEKAGEKVDKAQRLKIFVALRPFYLPMEFLLVLSSRESKL